MLSALEMVAEMKAVAEAEVAKFNELGQAIVTGEKAAHDAGFDEGVLQNTSPGDKIYSEEELQAELAPLKESIAALEQKIADIGDVDAKIAEAVKAEKLAIAAKIRDASVDDLAIAAELEA